MEIHDRCSSRTCVCGLTRSSRVTAASALTLEDTVLHGNGNTLWNGGLQPTQKTRDGTNLREPLYAAATKSPGSPGWSPRMSITRYGISCRQRWVMIPPLP